VVDEIFEALEHVPRPGVERTKLSVAIPLVPRQSLRHDSQDPPPTRDVYAYLPLRSYGFRFVLQVETILKSQLSVKLTTFFCNSSVF
jgi:hypothetical protein